MSGGSSVEVVNVVLDDPEAYDEAVHDSLPEMGLPLGTNEAFAHDLGVGTLRFITKRGAAASGRSGVAVTFFTMVDGKPTRVQAVVSLRALANACTLLTEELRKEDREFGSDG